MNTASTFPDDTVSAADYVAVDTILRQIDRRNSGRASLEPFAYWKLGFNLYRQLEFQYERDLNRDRFATIHRGILTALLAATESLDGGVEKVEDADLARIGLSREPFKGCARYVRRKYRQWYVPTEPQVIEIFEKKLAAQ